MLRGIPFVCLLACGRIDFDPHMDAGDATDAEEPSIRLSSHGQSTCVIREDHSLWCWGNNGSGQLGVGDATNHDPSQVPGQWDRVWTGENSTCARDLGGKISCWGRGDAGATTLGNTTDRLTPADASLPVGTDRLSLGEAHGCAVSDGKVLCWGLDSCGQVTGTPTGTVYTPREMTGLPEIVDVVVHDVMSCAIDTQGQVWCWGNWYGAFGSPYTGCGPALSPAPQMLPLPARVVSMQGSCHTHVCAALDDGSVYCWGQGQQGQMGNGMSVDVTSIQRTDLFGSALAATFVTLGAQTSCVRTANDLVYCWGDATQYQFADGTMQNQFVPKHVSTFDGRSIDAFDMGCFHGCAHMDGQLYCWGTNAARAVGDGTTDDQPMPVLITLP